MTLWLKRFKKYYKLSTAQPTVFGKLWMTRSELKEKKKKIRIKMPEIAK